MTRPFDRWGLVGLLVLGLTGCATVPRMVPQSLLDARASQGMALKARADLLVPEDYSSAQHSLEQAEGAFNSDQSISNIDELAFEAKAYAEIAEAGALQRVAQADIEQYKQTLLNQQNLLLALTQKDAELKLVQLQADQSTAARLAAEARAAAEGFRAQEEAARRAEAEREAEMLRKAQQIKNAEVKLEDRGLVINLSGKVLFDSGSSRLQTGALDQLGQVAKVLKDYPDYHVRVEGHTDSTGDLLMNNTLSQARAESVLEVLRQNGVTSDNMSAVGLGPSRPLTSNATATGRQMNRRVEIILEKKKP